MLDPHWDAAAQGFAVNIALIVIVGPQNLLVVRQALLGRPLLTTVVVCLVVDAALIALGVTGLGAAIAGRPWVAGGFPADLCRQSLADRRHVFDRKLR